MDYLFDETFQDYRLKEVEKAVMFLGLCMGGGGVSPEYFQGAMAMLKAIVNIPLDLAKTEEQKAHAQELRDTMMAEFGSQMIRQAVTE